MTTNEKSNDNDDHSDHEEEGCSNLECPVHGETTPREKSILYRAMCSAVGTHGNAAATFVQSIGFELDVVILAYSPKDLQVPVMQNTADVDLDGMVALFQSIVESLKSRKIMTESDLKAAFEAERATKQ